MTKSLIHIFLMSLALMSTPAWSTPASFDVDEAVTDAVEYDEWQTIVQSIQSIIDNNDIPVMVDAIRARCGTECSPMLVEKIIGDFYNAMGMICYENENYAEAEKCFSAACSLCIKYDYPDGILANLVNQGAVHLSLGDTALSVEKFAEAIVGAVAEGRIFANEQNLQRVMDFFMSLDQISPVMDKAVEFYNKEQGSKVEQLGIIHFLGAVYFSDRDSLEPAAEQFRLAAEFFDQAYDNVGRMYCTFALAEVYRRMGKSVDSVDAAYCNAIFIAVNNDSLEYLMKIIEAWQETFNNRNADGNFEKTFYKTIEAISADEVQKHSVLAAVNQVAVVNEMFKWDAEKKNEALEQALDFWASQNNAGKQVDILLLLAQLPYSVGENEKAKSYYSRALKICLVSRSWHKGQTLMSAITYTDLFESVCSEASSGLKNTEQAMLYVLATTPRFHWREDDHAERILTDSLEWVLKILEKSNDRSGMVITEQLLGAVDCYFDKRIEGERHYWTAIRHAIEINDSILAGEAISSAAEQVREPAMQIDAFDAFVQPRRDLEPWIPEYRMYIADEYRRIAGDQYDLVEDIFTACAETLALLDDPRRQQLAFRRAAISFYTDLESDSFSYDTLKAYRPTAPVENLKQTTFAGADSLYSYIDDLSSSCKLRGTDRWCLNYLEMLRGYIGLGCGNILRILADHEYQLASAELKRQWDEIDFMTSRYRALEILLMRVQAYAPRLHSDSIVNAYYEFQAKLSGRTYRLLPYQLRERLGEIVAVAQAFMRSANVRMLKYDLLGFADRTVEFGRAYGAGGASLADEIPDRFGHIKLEERIGAEESCMPVRFDYLNVRPYDWDRKRLIGMENTIASWKRNLYWDKGERDHWDLIDILLKIELGEYKMADSLLKASTGASSESKWVRVFHQYMHAELSDVLGRFQEALDSYDLSNRVVQDLEDNSYIHACIIGNSGNLWLRIGDNEKAQADFDSVMYAAAEDPTLKVLMARAYISRTNLKLLKAVADNDTATIDMAVSAYGSALSILTDVDEPNTMLAAKINLAVAYAAQYDLDAADSVLAEVIESARAGGFPIPLAGAQALRGYFLGLSGKYSEALECCSTAVSLYRQMGDQYSLSNSLATLGRVCRRLGDNENALRYMKESVGIFEAIRTQIDAIDISTTFTEANTDRYGEIIHLLVEMGMPKEAFSYVERSKAKSLKDAIDISKLETSNRQLRQALDKSKELEALSTQYEKELLQERSRSPDLVDSGKVAQLTKILAKTKSEFIKCGTDVIKLDPDYEALIKVTPGQLAKLQPLISPGTLFLEYYAAPDSVFIFEVGKKDFKVRTVSITRDSLYALVRKFRAMMSEAAASIQGGAGIGSVNSWDDSAGEEILSLKAVLSALYGTLIFPVADDMVAIENIVIIPSGLLSYLPFHALAHDTKDGYRFLVEEKNVSYLTASELMDIAKENLTKAKPNSFLGFANPDGSLPSAVKEVEAIKAVFPKAEIFTFDQATEDNACRLSADYNILHFATHAIIDESVPDESYILLAKGASEDGKWLMPEVYGMAWDKMNLVVLSACETALGEKDPGREVATLAYAFSVAGTPSVVASLWPVFDPSTQKLMKTFYESFKKETKTSSLRSAQISLLHDPQYAHPFFWAPFILIGDWR